MHGNGKNEIKIFETSIEALTIDLKNIHQQLDSFLSPIEQGCKPYTLEKLAYELKPKMVYGIGGKTQWYEHIKENESGLKGQILKRFSPEESKNLVIIWDNVIVGTRLLINTLKKYKHDDPAISMKKERLINKTESFIKIEAQIFELEAASYGYYDLKSKNSIAYPLGKQIYLAFDLKVEIERFLAHIEEVNTLIQPIINDLTKTVEKKDVKREPPISDLQVLNRIIDRFPIAIRSFNNKKRKGKPKIEFSDEYDFQDFLRLVISAFFEIKWEDPISASTIDTPTGKIEFIIPEMETLIETKFVNDDSSRKRALKSINNKIKVYSTYPNLNLLYFIIWDENSTIINPESLEKEYTGPSEFKGKKFFQKLKVIKK